MEFPAFADDVFLVQELCGLNRSQLADGLGVSRMTLNRWLQSPGCVSREGLETFYGFAFANGCRLNAIQEQLFREETLREGLIPLWHGSKSGIDGALRLDVSRQDNDFGPGFYVGDSLEQSALFVSRFPDSVVYAVGVDPSGLACRHFVVDQDWMLTVAWFRGRLREYGDDRRLQTLVESVQRADCVVAPIADNRMFALIDSFIDGEITDVQCQHSLAATNLGMQYVLRTPAALAAVRSLRPHYLCRAERARFLQLRMESDAVGRDKVKVAKRQYRGQGLYIDQTLSPRGDGDGDV